METQLSSRSDKDFTTPIATYQLDHERWSKDEQLATVDVEKHDRHPHY